MKSNTKIATRQAASIFIVLLMVVSIVAFLQPANAQTTPAAREIKILADGTIEDSNPLTPLIQAGDTYTFSGDVYGCIDIEKNGVTLDGAAYSLIGSDEMGHAVMVGGLGWDQPKVNGVTIKNMIITGFHYAIHLHGTGDVVSNVTVTGGTDYNGVGIWVDGTRHTIESCHIVGNKGMGILVDANGTKITDNVIADNEHFGINFYDTTGTLRNNAFNNNTAGPFHMDENQVHHAGQPFRIASNDIDSSNTVDGKPVCYWVNEHDKTVPQNAGYVVLDRCTGIVVDGLSIYRPPAGYPAYRLYAINLIRSSNIQVSDNNLENTGIWCSYSSQDITLIHNILSGGGIESYALNTSIIANAIAFPNSTAITVGGPAKATVAKNVLSGCDVGIDLETCSLSRIIQNSISNCKVGIEIFSSNNNTVTKNNFIDNTQQVSEKHSAQVWPLTQYYQSLNNVWNGNYWDTYYGTDANSDCVGDTPYVVFENITDYSPLMAPFDLAAQIPNVPQGVAPPMPSSSTAPTPSSVASPTLTTSVDTAPELPTVFVVIAVGVLAITLAVVALRIQRKKHSVEPLNT